MLLVTGGLGYIGSHTVVELQAAGYAVLILDNLSNAERAVQQKIASITGQVPELIVGDVLDTSLLEQLFARYPLQGVLHFAGRKAVAESVAQPLFYYQQNVVGTLSLLQAMERAKVRTLVFSSSATVYGYAAEMPISESVPLAPLNPYGATKATIEQILLSLFAADPTWRIAALRYFNPVGAHPSALIGELPKGKPANLMPYLCQVAAGWLPSLQVFGHDYPTPDGTGVRDYIHVVDLAKGHVAALQGLAAVPTLLQLNLGTGHGTSVLTLLKTFEQVTGQQVPYVMADRRPGDVATSYADPSQANQRLGWHTQYDLAAMCRDAWRWQEQLRA